MGDDKEVLSKTAAKLENEMRKISGFKSIGNSLRGQMKPEISVRPNLVQAAQLGVTTSQISEVLLVSTIGDVDSLLPKFSDESRQF